MTALHGVRMVVFPVADLEAGIAAWTELLGQPPLYGNDDFCVFDGGNVEIGLNRRPWAEQPLVFFKVDSVAAAHKELLAAGAKARADLGDGDPETGVVHLPTVTLAVVEAADGNLVGIREDVPWE